MSTDGPDANDKQVVVLRNDEVIDREAASWLTRLDRGELTQAERKGLRQWLAESSKHAEALNEMASMWRDMDFLLNDLSEVQSKRTNLSEVFTIKPRLIAIAASLLIAVFGVFGANYFFSVERMVYYTDIGSQMTQEFSDGSSALLNTNSVIEIEYSRSKRIVRLMRGEAFFDVAHDSSRPFIVYVGDQAVRAVGTAFVVKIESENIQVTVTEGKVQLSKREEVVSNNTVASSQEVILINKGEWVNLDGKSNNPKPQSLEQDEFERQLSWSSGQLVFDNERLEDVIKEISRYIPNKIVIEGDNLKNVRVSGRFSLGDAEALLEAIEVSLDLDATAIEGRQILLSR